MEMRSEGKKRSSERAAAAAGLELLRSLSPAIAVVDIDECAGDEFELLILSVAQGRDLEMFFPQPPTPPPSASPAGIDSRLVPVPIQLELPPSFGKASSLPQEEQEEEKQVIKVSQVDQDTQLSQVYFKKTWENEFADMKILDSPKSPTCRSPKFMHQQTDKLQFDENLGQEITSPGTKVVDQNSLLESSEDTKEINNSNNNNNNNIWKLSFTGIGAICSFGFAAATICIIFFGAHQRNKQYQHNQNRFQIYTDDNKRIKQAVEHATKLNEAFSAARGVPLPRAHVTYGGYYNGL